MQPYSGTITYSPQSVIGHLDQEPVFDDLSKTLIEYLQKRFLLPEHKLRSLLSPFGLVEGSFIKQPIGTISLGQQRQLQLLELMIGGSNVLLLDGPTNHLAPSVDQLEEALLSFKGAVIAATHDRSFAEKIGSHFLKW
jgi:ATPase subunit of ABC transporter with duplicated ATPase domains